MPSSTTSSSSYRGRGGERFEHGVDVVGARHADRRAHVRRLDEHHRSQLGEQVLGQTRGAQVVHVDRPPAGLGDPVGVEDGLGHHLVHRNRGAEDAGADVRQAGQLEQALDGAVLAVRSVEHGDDHGAARVGVGGRQGQRIGTGAGHVDRRRQRPTVRHQRHRLLGQLPVTVAGDADGHHLVAVGVDGRHHVAGRHPADVVLGGSPTEQHDQADALRQRFCGRVHGAGVWHAASGRPGGLSGVAPTGP